MNFKDKKVVLMGLGNYKDGSGISAALFFARNNAKLLITDLQSKKELAPQIKKLKKFPNIKYILGRHREDDFKNADYIFKNPSVPKDSPYLKIARQNKIPVINDWTIFFEERPGNLLIGITGSKGKSTTTALIYQLLKIAKKDVVLCGNIGKSPLAVLQKIKKDTIIVAELSSWLLQEFKSIKHSPRISVITNLMPEHLDKYKNIREYYGDKENIFRFQRPNDYLILNKNDKKLKSMARKAKSRIIWYDGEPKNAGFAIAKILKISKKIANKAAQNFKGLSGRLELIREKNGVKYYNDTTATMPDATIYALHSLKKYKGRIILIAGGVDKKLDYKNLARLIKKSVKALVLLEGTASDKILKEMNIKNEKISSMQKAVATASKLASKNDVVLLSPAAASFNLFRNEFDRGKQYDKAVSLIS